MANTQTPNVQMVNTRMLRAHMTLKGISTKGLADALGWKSTSTAYRKINGEVAFTVPEVQLCKDLLELDAATTNEIFFAADLS